MKATLTLLVLLTASTVSVQAQSKSFRTLREKFSGTEKVFSIRTSGFMARTILWVAGEHAYNDAIREVKNVRLVVIPKSAFSENNVTLTGFRKLTREDGFEELTRVRDHGDDVTLLIQTPTRKKLDNRYLILVEEENEVVVVEVRGYIDPDLLLKNNNTLAYK
jgi:hypothetical protein